MPKNTNIYQNGIHNGATIDTHPKTNEKKHTFLCQNTKKRKTKKALPSGLQCFLMKARPNKALIPKLRPLQGK